MYFNDETITAVAEAMLEAVEAVLKEDPMIASWQQTKTQVAAMTDALADIVLGNNAMAFFAADRVLQAADLAGGCQYTLWCGLVSVSQVTIDREGNLQRLTKMKAVHVISATKEEAADFVEDKARKEFSGWEFQVVQVFPVDTNKVILRDLIQQFTNE